MDTDSTGMGGDKDNIQIPPMPSNPSGNGVVANINSTSDTDYHAQSYNAVTKKFDNRLPTSNEFSAFIKSQTPKNKDQHELSALINVALFRGNLNEITKKNGYSWTIKPIMMEVLVTEQIKGTTVVEFSRQDQRTGEIDVTGSTSATLSLQKKYAMRYEISFAKDGNLLPSLTTTEERPWKTETSAPVTLPKDSVPSVIKPSIDLAIGMRLSKQHFDLNTITEYSQKLESFSLFTDTSKYLGVGNDLLSLTKISTGYFGLVKTGVDLLVLDQITSYYQEMHKNDQRQATNPGEYMSWKLLNNNRLNNTGLQRQMKPLKNGISIKK